MWGFKVGVSKGLRRHLEAGRWAAWGGRGAN
jgi:hypothetical protein